MIIIQVVSVTWATSLRIGGRNEEDAVLKYECFWYPNIFRLYVHTVNKVERDLGKNSDSYCAARKYNSWLMDHKVYTLIESIVLVRWTLSTLRKKKGRLMNTMLLKSQRKAREKKEGYRNWKLAKFSQLNTLHGKYCVIKLFLLVVRNQKVPSMAFLNSKI